LILRVHIGLIVGKEKIGIVPGCRLAAEEESSPCHLQPGIPLETKIEGEDIKHVEMLALVLVGVKHQ
jgi:hypothetical protein